MRILHFLLSSPSLRSAARVPAAGAYHIALVVALAVCAALPADRAAADRIVAVTCRDLSAAHAGGTAPPVAVRWVQPKGAADRRSLDRWCGAVGPVVAERSHAGSSLPATGAPVDAVADELVVVTWNVHVGGGDLDALVHGLRSGALAGGRPARHFVLLLQEAHRGGPTVPGKFDPSFAFASAIQPVLPGHTREDVAVVARRLGLHLFYVPSMRNGGPDLSEDRGNAIVSTLPLEDLVAVELPFERQRRVAVAATVRGRTSAGTPWHLVIASVHLDNLVGLRNAWIFNGPARQRQIRGLIDALPSNGPAVVGGDLNSWFGFHDPAYLEAADRFPDTPTSDRRPTFAGLLRLDHLFFRLPAGWRARSSRIDDRFGSDHHPVLGSVRFAEAGSGL